jgi:hypothetical protein
MFRLFIQNCNGNPRKMEESGTVAEYVYDHWIEMGAT